LQGLNTISVRAMKAWGGGTGRCRCSCNHS